jgi:TM2 domain-containing membrane protein YozV
MTDPQYQPPPGYYPPPSGYPFQPYYGVPVDPSAPFGRDPVSGEPLSDKSKVAAGLLQLFLGGFGVGRFYIGSNAIGFAQLGTWIVGFLLLFAFGLGLIVLFGLAIWTLVDAIMMFAGSVRDQYGRRLR